MKLSKVIHKLQQAVLEEDADVTALIARQEDGKVIFISLENMDMKDFSKLCSILSPKKRK